MKSEVTYDFDKLNKLVTALTGKFYVKVGIMGSKNARKSGTVNNASLGAIHEFGTMSGKIPPRSFLRMPLAHQQTQILKDAGIGMLGLLLKGDVLMVLKRLGIACENAVQLAFATRGFNMWRPNRVATAMRKKSDAPLIDTGQLRRSITSKVEKTS